MLLSYKAAVYLKDFSAEDKLDVDWSRESESHLLFSKRIFGVFFSNPHLLWGELMDRFYYIDKKIGHKLSDVNWGFDVRSCFFSDLISKYMRSLY